MPSALDPGRARLVFDDAVLRAARGDLRGSVDSYRGFLALEPNHAGARSNLAAVLAELGRLEEAAAECRRAIELDADLAVAHANLGSVLATAGDLEAAQDCFERALHLAPALAPAALGLGRTLARLGRDGDALAAYRRALELAPGAAEIAASLGDLLLERGEARAALDTADDFLRARPGHSGMLALRAAALLVLGQSEAGRALLDFDRLVLSVRLAGDTVALNDALARHVRGHPTLTFEPASHATVGGFHTGSLLSEPKGPISVLEDAVNAAVAEAWRSLPADPALHPLLAGRPGVVRLDMWAVILGAGAHQIPHIHPEAWLSGVYYVALPLAMKASGARDATNAGWLELCPPPRAAAAPAAPAPHALRPEEGMLLLFPSHLHHRTIPFEGEGERISIAFDVVPVG